MKNANKIALFALTTALLSISCDKEDVNIPDLQDTRSTVQVGSWRITVFEDDGMDETADFADYTFTFAEGGALTATDGTTTQTGVWSVENDRDEDDQEDDLDFIISFPVGEDSIFDDLTDDWDVISVTDNRIALIDEDEEDDRLTFVRN